MVDERLQSLIKHYAVDIKSDTRGGGVAFIKITDTGDHNLSIEAQYVNDAIYAVYFLNNQFYDIPNEVLYECIGSILDGKYIVKRSWFSNKIWIKLLDRKVQPTRIDKSDVFQDVYKMMPRTWTRK